MKVKVNGNVCMYGYFQSYRYFMSYEREIRLQYRVIDVYRERSRILLDALRALEPDLRLTLVGVHVRRGDRVHSAQFNTLYRVASELYLRSAMRDFSANYTNVRFVMASDDLEWCRRIFGNTSHVLFVSGTMDEDFSTLVACDHSITTVGTFSWWVGWLAGGVVTYYADHAPPSTYIYTNLSPRDYYLPEWIPYHDT